MCVNIRVYDFETVKVKVLVIHSRLTLCDPMDCGPPGSSVHGILQARILERIAMPFSRGSSSPRDRTRSLALQVDSLQSELPEKQCTYIKTFMTGMARDNNNPISQGGQPNFPL